jgi:hypothetical protein
MVTADDSNFESIANLLQDGTNRGFITDTDWLSVLVKAAKGNVQFTKLNERIISNYWGLSFDSTSFIYKAFDRKICQLVESGIAEKIVSEFVSYRSEEVVDEPVVLTLSHLEYWFFAWAALLALALVCFVVERCSSIVLKN